MLLPKFEVRALLFQVEGVVRGAIGAYPRRYKQSKESDMGDMATEKVDTGSANNTENHEADPTSVQSVQGHYQQLGLEQQKGDQLQNDLKSGDSLKQTNAQKDLANLIVDLEQKTKQPYSIDKLSQAFDLSAEQQNGLTQAVNTARQANK
jgi:hypothetical protein